MNHVREEEFLLGLCNNCCSISSWFVSCENRQQTSYCEVVLKLLIEVFKKCLSQVLSYSHAFLRNEPNLEEILRKIAFHGQIFLAY